MHFRRLQLYQIVVANVKACGASTGKDDARTMQNLCGQDACEPCPALTLDTVLEALVTTLAQHRMTLITSVHSFAASQPKAEREAFVQARPQTLNP